MKNILSFMPGTKFFGQEILDWAKFQKKNKTSHKKQGDIILRKFGNLVPHREYQVFTHYQGTGGGEIIHKPMIVKT